MFIANIKQASICISNGNYVKNIVNSELSLSKKSNRKNVQSTGDLNYIEKIADKLLYKVSNVEINNKNGFQDLSRE